MAAVPCLSSNCKLTGTHLCLECFNPNTIQPWNCPNWQNAPTLNYKMGYSKNLAMGITVVFSNINHLRNSSILFRHPGNCLCNWTGRDNLPRRDSHLGLCYEQLGEPRSEAPAPVGRLRQNLLKTWRRKTTTRSYRNMNRWLEGAILFWWVGGLGGATVGWPALPHPHVIPKVY